MLAHQPVKLVGTAFHEAGHSVAAFHFGVKIEHVGIQAPDEWTLGYVRHARQADWETVDVTADQEATALRAITLSLAGGGG